MQCNLRVSGALLPPATQSVCAQLLASLVGRPVVLTTVALFDAQRIMGVKYSFPANLRLSAECLDLIRQVFVANPAQRVTLKGLKQHPWFLTNLPDELKVPSLETAS